MSAYLCSDDTINLIIAAGVRAARRNNSGQFNVKLDALDAPSPTRDYLNFFTDAAVMAGMLYDENVRSVNYRYNDRDPAPPFTYRNIDVDRVAAGADVTWQVIALKSIECLRYQSCECPDYRDTNAAALLDRIQNAVMWCLPGMNDAAPWGWTEDWTAARVRVAKAKVAGILPASWTGEPCPQSPDTCWIDNATGEHIDAQTGARTKDHPHAHLEPTIIAAYIDGGAISRAERDAANEHLARCPECIETLANAIRTRDELGHK